MAIDTFHPRHTISRKQQAKIEAAATPAPHFVIHESGPCGLHDSDGFLHCTCGATNETWVEDDRHGLVVMCRADNCWNEFTLPTH